MINIRGQIEDKTDKEIVESLSNDTHLQDEITVTYADLVKTFGKPDSDGDGYKVDAEWNIMTINGLATIYNYKTGLNYLGTDGKVIVKITDWHIRGSNNQVVEWITTAINNKKENHKIMYVEPRVDEIDYMYFVDYVIKEENVGKLKVMQEEFEEESEAYERLKELQDELNK